jgi:O-antigen/teichoic acid export membrane protein
VLSGYFAASAGIYVAFRLFGHREGVVADPGDGDRDREDDLVKSIRRYAHQFMATALVGWISSLSDRYVIAGLLGPASVGIYAATSGLMSRAFIMPSTILLLTLRPGYFDAVARGDRVAERRIQRAWLFLTVAMCGVGVLAVFFLRDWLGDLLIAKEYHSAVGLMPVLALGFSFLCLSHVFNYASLSYNRPWNMFYSEAAGAVVAVGMSIPLVILYGLAGAATATVTAYFVQAALAYFLARSAMRRIGAPEPVQS